MGIFTEVHAYLLRVITVSQIRGGADYLGRHLRANDYYSKGERVQGEWWGRGAEMLGLENQEVRSRDFLSLEKNQHPETGDRLRERVAKVNWHDFVVSAPKSFSVAAMTGGDERLLDAFDRSVRNVFERLESFASVRLRQGQNYHTENTRVTGNAVAAVFRHDTSRLLDPQVHTHLVFGNVSWDWESGRWLALQPKQMAEESKEWIRGAFYRDLAGECERLGYAVESDGEAFRLKELDPQIEKLYQQRTRQRTAFEARYKELFGHAPSPKRVEEFIKERKTAAKKRFKEEFRSHFGKWPSQEKVDAFVLDPRSDKMASSSREEVHSRQRSLLTEQQKESLDAFVLTARNRVNGQDESHQQRHQEEVQKKEKLKPEVKESVSRTQKSRTPQQTQSPKQRVIRQQAYGRMEAYRRMKRGMAIARAFQGHPAGLLLRQLTTLANQKRYEDQQRTRML